jgi:hypothetical protein
MKNHFSSITKLVALAACALSLGSCSRSEYAMLPKGGSYHGVTRVATPVPAAPATATATVTTPAPAETTVAAPAPVATEAPAPAVAKAPAKAAQQPAAASSAAATTVAAAPAPKLSLVQRMALNKVTRKVDKLMQKSGSVRKHDNTASTARGGIDGNLRIGLILLLIGLLLGLINGLIGSIVAIIGLVFIVLWLLDQA